MKSREPLVSVIMNCYNCAEYLNEAIESVLNQTYQNWEIIFWDNCSTDSSVDIVKSFTEKRIRYLSASSFTPLGVARNLAIEQATGEWIAFLDCDDLWDRDKLILSFSQLYKAVDLESISLIYSKSYKIDRDNNIVSTSPESPSGYIYEKLLKEGDFIVLSSIIVRKDILLYCGNIDESLNYCEDYDLLLKISREYQALGIDKHLTSYRVHSDNITSKKIYDNNIELIEFLNRYTSDNTLSMSIKANIYLNNSYRTLKTVIKLLLDSRYRQSISFMVKYITYLPLSPIATIKVKIFDRIRKSNLSMSDKIKFIKF